MSAIYKSTAEKLMKATVNRRIMEEYYCAHAIFGCPLIKVMPFSDGYADNPAR